MPEQRPPASVGSPRRRSPDYTAPAMPLPQKPVRQSSRLTMAVAISLIAHAVLLPFLARDAMFHVQHKQGVSIISGRQFRDLVASQLRTAANGPITTSGQQVPATPREQKKPEQKAEEQQ